MQWYNYPIIFLGIVGILLALFGNYHGHGIKKTGVWGWALIILLLIIRVSIWIYNLMANIG